MCSVQDYHCCRLLCSCTPWSCNTDVADESRPHRAGAGQSDFEFLLETKVSPAIGLLGLVNIDLSGLLNNQFALHVINTAAGGPVVQVCAVPAARAAPSELQSSSLTMRTSPCGPEPSCPVNHAYRAESAGSGDSQLCKSTTHRNQTHLGRGGSGTLSSARYCGSASK